MDAVEEVVADCLDSFVLAIFSLIFYALAFYLPRTIYTATLSAWVYHSGDGHAVAPIKSWGRENYTMSRPADHRMFL